MLQRYIKILLIGIILTSCKGSNLDIDKIIIYQDYVSSAIVISDKSEIATIFNLTENNNSFSHACGYDVNFSFIKNGKIQKEIPFNVECEQFRRHSIRLNMIFRSYYRKLINSPTCKIVNVKVSNTFDRERVYRELMENEYFYIDMDGETSNLPFIKISFENEFKLPKDKKNWVKIQNENEKLCEKKLQSVIDTIMKKYAVNTIGQFRTPIVTTTSNFMTVKLFFELGVDTTGISSLLKQNEVKIEESNFPQDYWLQLIVDKDLSLNILQEEFERFDWFEKINIYPEK